MDVFWGASSSSLHRLTMGMVNSSEELLAPAGVPAAEDGRE